ncbi:GDSL-type esterase/lipase family protein [Companilactobacillus muriivasis]|uniref:GDSL-type esterase/lipase family protein n=1 Tax=Companilactobacillus muriivasis TaxID=3081444 RepID=UPI0030C74C08
MIATTTWKHNLTNYENINNINDSGFQHLEIFQPLATNKIRLQLNNLYDEIPLEISKIEIYSNSSDKKIITLDGSSRFQVEPRLIEWSDWIDINLTANSTLSIDIYSSNKTIHTVGMTISNDIVKTTETDSKIPKYFFGISAIQVETKSTYKKIAFFGDSLTNQGNYSAPLSLDLETNFHIMTANYGISGNRLLRPGHSTSQWSTSFGEAGFTRFDHMLTNYQPNLVVFMEGLNDLLHPGTGAPMNELPTAEAVVKAIYILKAKCRKYDAKFVPMTITPFGNSDGWTPGKEAIRQKINNELLKMPHILDISALVGKDNQLLPEFDCGDHVHFSANGGKIIADYIKEQLIRKKMI